MQRSIDDTRWEAVQKRDRRLDGRFVFAVTSTGIFCRPSCPSRRPRRQNVRFYSSTREAERAGYRACLRCRPDSVHGTAAEKAVEMTKAFLDSAASGADAANTDLKSLAARAGVSPFHLQRHFKRIVGLTPKGYLTKKRSTLLRSNLKKGGSVLRAVYESGFNSPSQAYAAAGKEIGMSPSAYRKQGSGIEISYWISKTSFGRMIVGATARGVCAVLIGDSDTALVAALRSEFPKATLRAGSEGGNRTVAAVTRLVESGHQENIPLDVGGTPFQWKVWEALRRIPSGETRTYAEIARSIGKPNAARAVGRACASNRAAILIPCHRVVRGDGVPGEYRWGSTLKHKLLRHEAGSADK
jgi:AraC family transcriptional regulator, regulatory protein of adaptative response / methylated-DNA-[protein]-cysteine methyltransferase